MLYCIVSYCMWAYKYHIVSYCTVLYCNVSYRIIWYGTIHHHHHLVVKFSLLIVMLVRVVGPIMSFFFYALYCVNLSLYSSAQFRSLVRLQRAPQIHRDYRGHPTTQIKHRCTRNDLVGTLRENHSLDCDLYSTKVCNMAFANIIFHSFVYVMKTYLCLFLHFLPDLSYLKKCVTLR